MTSIAAAEGVTIQLKTGKHCRLIKVLIEKFVPHFVPGSRVLYASDTNNKWGYVDEEGLRALDVNVDMHEKMPDIVLYYPLENWILLVEAVTNHGPVDVKRRSDLAKLFNRCSASLVYVTAFTTRSEMGRYLAEIAWDTEVWLADMPEHMIHFNGDRFLGPR